MKNVFTIRAILIGAILSILICVGDVYNLMVTNGSYMTLDFTTPAAIFILFFLAILNLPLKKFFPRLALSVPELILISIMLMVAASIPTMGLTLYLVPLISGVKYYANPQNEWGTTLLPHIKSWLIVQDDMAVKWFYEGLPKGESIPWVAWMKPLAAWLPLIVTIYLVMIFIMVIMRKQWVEREKLTYPMTKAPLELIHSTENHLFRNRLFWIGFSIPVVLGCINGLHHYIPLIPGIKLAQSISIFRRTLGLDFRISFPMIGFTYFVNQQLAFSLWFFCLCTTVVQGIFNITGFEQRDFLPYNLDRPTLGWLALGALIYIVLYGLWMSRGHFKSVWRLVRTRQDDPDEIVSPTIAFWGMAAGLLFLFLWLVASGLSPIISLILIFFLFLIYIGITRAVVEGGIATTRAPVIAPVITTSFLGPSYIGPQGLASLGMSFIYNSDVRTFVMVSVANGLKMLDEIAQNKRRIFLAILVAIVVSLFSSILTVLLLGYKNGAINANSWFFINGPQYPLRYYADKIRYPGGPDWLYMGFVAFGSLFALLLQFMRMRFFWFPFHPLGFAFSTVMMTNALWFSIFLAWLIKLTLLKYGGAQVYERSKIFFIALIVGQFVVNGFWLILDFITRHTGNMLYWA